MDIFEKIAFAQSMSDDTRKQNLIPMLEDLLNLLMRLSLLLKILQVKLVELISHL